MEVKVHGSFLGYEPMEYGRWFQTLGGPQCLKIKFMQIEW
jgi:hypothetical protein